MKLTNPRQLLQLMLLVAVVAGVQQVWVSHERAEASAEAATALSALARPGDIHMLSSDICPSCGAARQWLSANAVPYTECSIERDPACRATFEATRAPGTPVLRVTLDQALQRLAAGVVGNPTSPAQGALLP
jgi:glutaredoxin